MMMLANIIPASSLSVSPPRHHNPNPPPLRPLPPLFPISSSTITVAALSSHHYYNTEEIITRRRTKSSRRRTRWAVSASASSDNQMAVAAPPSTTASPSSSEVVRNFYGGINGRDLASVEDLIAQNCVYEDLIFSRPFVGRKAILEFFQKFIDSISMDLQFVIDDISNEDTSALGVTWHLEWKGKPFPFSKGCSFYRLDVVNGKRQIIYGRDCVEPATKPGEIALVAIRGVTLLLQQFPQLADRL